MTNSCQPTPEDLQNLRMSRGLSIRGLAKLLQVDKSTIYRWEHGKSAIKQTTWISIQTLLNGSISAQALFNDQVK